MPMCDYCDDDYDGLLHLNADGRSECPTCQDGPHCADCEEPMPGGEMHFNDFDEAVCFGCA